MRRCLSKLTFVPKHEPPTEGSVQTLQNFINSNSRIFLLTGAGVSTESGIPDYRSDEVGLYARSNHRPMKIQEFLSSREAQRRYWARNFLGWPRFAALEPNPAHKTLREWELSGERKLSGLVTQNVDGLHQKAGSSSAIELHGTGHTVICLQCDYRISRHLFQNVLLDLNSHLDVQPRQDEIRPDGDVELMQDVVDKFILPSCPKCVTGPLKPYIVFFGDNVPRDRVDQINDVLNASDSLLVLGSSLQTFSSFRYILSARQRNLPVGIVNLGPTRADELCDFKIRCRVGELLPMIAISGS